MKSRKRVLACSGSIRLPRCCHQRTRMSCQRSIAARRSAGSRDVAQLEPPVLEAAQVPAQVLAALARQPGEVLLERARQLDAGVWGWAAAVRSAQPARQHGALGRRAGPHATQQQRVPLVAVRAHLPHRERRRPSRARTARTARPSSCSAGAQLGQDPERAAPRQHQRRQADEPAAVAHRDDERRSRSRPSAATTRAPTRPTRTAWPRRRPRTAAPIRAAAARSVAWTSVCMPSPRPRSSAGAAPQAQHPQDPGRDRGEAQQHSRQRVAGSPRGAGAGVGRALEQPRRRTARPRPRSPPPASGTSCRSGRRPAGRPAGRPRPHATARAGWSRRRWPAAGSGRSAGSRRAA